MCNRVTLLLTKRKACVGKEKASDVYVQNFCVSLYLFDGLVHRQFSGLLLGLTEHDGFPMAAAVNLDHVPQHRRALGPVAGDGEMLQDEENQGDGRGGGKG